MQRAVDEDLMGVVINRRKEIAFEERRIPDHKSANYHQDIKRDPAQDDRQRIGAGETGQSHQCDQW